MISWVTPAPFTYGTTLSSIQLDATANIPGSFSYTPTVGALLGAGTNFLSVVFTPSDTTDFSSASNSVTVIITPASVSILSGVTANTKIYDGTTAATLRFCYVVLTGILEGDSANVNTNDYSATFANGNIGPSFSCSL